MRTLLDTNFISRQLRIGILTFLIVATPAQAGLLNQCIRTLTQLALPYAVEHHTGKTLRAINRDLDPTEVVLGERIGLGDRGGLYRIKPSSTLPGIPLTTVGLVAKIPHTVRLSGKTGPHPQAELEMKREIETYELLATQWAKVKSDPAYPKDPAWIADKIPTAPILKTISTKEGTVLIKPEIQGQSLKSLWEQTQGKLPEEMNNSLREIYSMIKAVSHQIKTPIQDGAGEWKEGRPFFTDISSANLTWVSNEAQMKLLGLKRPSFVFYEMTPLINRMPQ
ncbi:MAG: hypothetical protein ACKOA8_19605, partial [Deltaproteobacteria bacterium]